MGKNLPYIAAALILLIFVPMMFLGFAVAAAFAGLGGSGGGSTGSGGATAGTCTVQLSKSEAYQQIDSNGKEPPPVLISVYQAAAEKYKLGPKGASILAGINSIETNFGRSTLPGVRSGTNSAGAGGPMQFIGSTWDAYGVDGNGDGQKDIYDPIDAIFGSANYLHASGAPGDWQSAIFAYNHAGWYVADVLQRAEKYNVEPGGPC